MDWKRVSRWVAGVSGTISAVLAAAVGVTQATAWAADQAWAPASHFYVNGMATGIIDTLSTKLNDISNEVAHNRDLLSAKLDDISNDAVRNRLDTLRVALAQLNSERAQLDDLRARNPESDLLRLQLKELDGKIMEYDRMLRLVTCDFTKRLQTGAVCTP